MYFVGCNGPSRAFKLPSVRHPAPFVGRTVRTVNLSRLSSQGGGLYFEKEAPPASISYAKIPPLPETRVMTGLVPRVWGFYPVFTHKHHTDVSYLACARALLDAPDAIFPPPVRHTERGHHRGHFADGGQHRRARRHAGRTKPVAPSLRDLPVGPAPSGERSTQPPASQYLSPP